jgi:Ca-activated chloride channel family protein
MIVRHRGLVCTLTLSVSLWGCQHAPEQGPVDAPRAAPTRADSPAQTVAPMVPPPVEAASVAAPELEAALADGPAPEAKDDGAVVRARRAAPKRAGAMVGSGRAGSGAPAASAPHDMASRALHAPVKRKSVMSAPPPAGTAEFDTEAYADTEETAFARATDTPLSTFSIDVDTASYSNVRRFLNQGQLPPEGAVRVEELINYFSYAYPEPTDGAPFSVTTEVSQAPWSPQHRLLHVGLQSERLATSELPPRNLVFLLDVSGSMDSPNKLPLLERSLENLVETLGAKDRVAIVVYAGATGLVLEPTPGDRHARIFDALDKLQAGGSTNGGEGIQLAYSVAAGLARPGSTNRVILATDGDFNVGVTSQSELVSLIEEKRKSGVYLSVLGFGMGNYKDSTLELLADKGNGNYAYIDSLAEARKVLVAQAGATLVTLAKDVKLQLEFNPENVAAYRLIGYENRRLADRDFNDDAKDAGEIGAGHSVTALYEIVPPGVPFDGSKVDALKYQTPSRATGKSGELCTIKIRYKAPNAERSQLLERVVSDRGQALGETSPAFRFSAAVAVFGMTLRHSEARGSSSFGLARELANGAMSSDPGGYRREFLSLLDTAQSVRR